jgi:ABC-2 type transport system ATP-binding protein
MAPVIEVHGLRKTFFRLRGGRTVAVDGLDLEVEEGGVFGFLGPNGSGKTTTIRVVLGLHHATDGEVRLMGNPVPRGLPEVMSKVGALVEAPAFHPGITGWKNLLILARVAGVSAGRVREVLKTVGLEGREDDRVKAYSLGMKQRLAIGAALLKDPPLLVLDEPANGLDPAGIREVRELVRRLGSEGRTVFVSSHQLHEVQQMCDHVAILSRGKLVRSGAVEEVLAGGKAHEYRVTVGRRGPAETALKTAGFKVRRDGDDLLVTASTRDAAKITRTLANRAIYLTGLRPELASLEAVFLEMTEDPKEET